MSLAFHIVTVYRNTPILTNRLESLNIVVFNGNKSQAPALLALTCKHKKQVIIIKIVNILFGGLCTKFVCVLSKDYNATQHLDLLMLFMKITDGKNYILFLNPSKILSCFLHKNTYNMLHSCFVISTYLLVQNIDF